ncbi:MAG: aspartate-semialdehyde dehydrogenase [Spirochaetia bacterium]|nr:aspartate-semialdehyde dehydrogenase [Spirochaetia bacterium]
MSTQILPQSPKNVAIAGATGAVGREFISVLEKINYPIKNIKLLSSKRSAGEKMNFAGEEITVEEMNKDSFKGVDIALFSAGSSISKEYAKSVTDSGCILIDNSSAFRMLDDVPLVVPEVNAEDIKNNKGIIANPNCSTIIMLMAVFPLHQKNPVKRIVTSTYQAASGGGWAVMDELMQSTKANIEGKAFVPKELPFDYGFNLFSHNTPIGDNGYNQEEMKMVKETQKILHNNDIAIAATCVRVPVLRAHCISINLEFINSAPSVDEARDLLKEFSGVQIVDDRENNHFPMPIEASGIFDCLVGRIRKDISNPGKGLELFVAGDQLLKGAALNAVQIACYL